MRYHHRMTDTIGLLAGSILRLLHSRRTLLLENLALRQQLAALKRKHPKPRLSVADKLFWILARRFWSRWKQTLIVVTPETVVRWHRAGFRLYWKLISKVPRPIGRKQTPKEVRDLIFRMVAENPTWGAPRIHGELLMLGFDVSERTISRWMRRAPRNPEPAKRWLSFLRNTEKPSPPWISLLFRRSRLSCSTASSLLVMTVAGSCTAMSPAIRPALGSSSSCVKHFPISPLPSSCSWITIRNMGWKSRLPFGP